MNIDPEILRSLEAAGLTRAQVERVRDLEARAMGEGLPGFGDARRAASLRTQATRPAARPAAAARPALTCAAVRAGVAALAAAYWSKHA